MSSRVLTLFLAALLLSLPAAAVVRVSCFGDSHTSGVDDETGIGGYPPRLASLLRSNGVEATVRNYGRGGETTTAGVTRIDTILEFGGDVLILLEGANDISRFISPETTVFNLEEIATRAEKVGFSVIHATPIPRIPGASVDPANQLNASLAGDIRGLGLARGRTVVDLFSAWDAIPDLFQLYYSGREGDQVGHPNAAGYQLMAEHFLPAATRPCHLGSRIVPDFEATPSTGAAPLAVTFSDLSSPTPLLRDWDLDDDGAWDASGDHPVHVFEDGGEHAVALRVSDGECAAVLRREDAVHVLPVPAAPELSAQALSPSEIFLSWDEAPGATHYLLEGKVGAGGYELLEALPAGSTYHFVDGVEARSYHAFRLRAGNDQGLSDWSEEVSVTTPAEPGECVPSSEILCLLDGRLAVSVEWRDFEGRVGRGTERSLGGRSGTFWFFDEANLEMIVKVLDGTATNGHLWFFYGSLSSVEFVVTITDTASGSSRSYVNPAGQMASQGDIEAIPSPGGGGSQPAIAHAGSTSDEVLLLHDGRFEVRAEWRDFQGGEGVARAIPDSEESGFLWFFRPDNVELVVKVLDGRPINGHFWVFYGAISNVEYTLRVLDTETGVERVFANPAGHFASASDVEAF